ncbi:MAG: serine/threonine protein kinase [Fuerstiella sp.]|nr:serine/threonine protein kinase [Fuerstiella sp.]
MAAYHYQQGDRPLDGYTIRYALGRGGFGEVYFAVSDSGREVALKAVQNFEEVELRGIGHCMNLKSPHLVMIFDIKHAADGKPWVIMEYVSGPSLREVLDESPDGLGIDQAKFFLRELAKGLSYLHEAGVVHRDLKPHNVFFEDGIVKIGDYSLSKVITASHRSGNTMTVGSVHYMAPEISLGRYDRTVDIYALGIMLYEMLAGQPPYVGESMGEVLMKHLSSDPDVSQLPEPFAGVIVKAMQRDPANRFQTAQEMVEAVEGAAPLNLLHDSFNPTTLSLVGERARNAKARQAAVQASVPEVAVDIAPPLSHSTAPTAVQDTGPYARAGNTASEVVPEIMKPPLPHRVGLAYSPPQRQHDIPDATLLVPRLFLAALATMILIFLSLKTVNDYWSGRVMLGVASLTFVLSAATATIARRFPLLHVSIGGSVLSRIGWSLPVVLAWIVVLNLVRVDDELCGPLACSVMICTLLFDWRCLITVHRHPRVSLLPVFCIGVVAAASHLMMSNYTGWTPFAGALAMAAAITVQLVAPVRRASTDAPAIKRPQKAKKPRLLYDRTAMLLELIIGAAVAVIVSLMVNGDDDGGLIAVGVIAGFVGIFALRFRLHRRSWSDEGPATALAAGSPSALTARHPGVVADHADGTLSFDRATIAMEMMVGAAAAVIIGLFINGDDEGPFIVLGVIAAFIGTFALRFRIQRRVWSNERPGLAPGVRGADAITQQQQGDFDGGDVKVVTIDKLSIFLEVLFLASATLVGGLMFNGDDDLFPLGAAAAIVGLLALRFRFRRHRFIQRREAVSGLRLSFDKTSVFQELLIGVFAVVAAAVLFEGDDDLFGLAAAAVVVAVVTIRFRLSRLISHERPDARNSGQRPDNHMTRQDEEMREIR